MDGRVAERLTRRGSDRPLRSRQNGAVLFLGLALMLAITAAALSGAYTTTLELHMSRNSHDTALAFHAADAALAEAAAWLDGNGDPADGDPDANPGPHYGEVPLWRDRSAWDGHGRTAATPLPGVSEAPRFLIEWITTLESEAPPAGTPVDVFRVTARGVGRSPNTVVRLQGTYARTRGGVPGTRMRRLSWVELES